MSQGVAEVAKSGGEGGGGGGGWNGNAKGWVWGGQERNVSLLHKLK